MWVLHIQEGSKKEKSISKSKETSSRLVIFVRHGDYNFWANTAEAKVLTPCGKRQAELTGRALKNNICGRPAVGRIVTSTLIRAEQTACIIKDSFPSVPLETDSLLEEGNPDSLYIRERFESVIQKYLLPAQGPERTTDIIVSHSNLIRYIFCRYVC